MSVLITGMKMPKSCNECQLTTQYYDGGIDVCCPLDKYVLPSSSKRDDCPLVEVPPHGRLIDADAFIAEQRHLYCENCERRKGMKNGKVKFVYDIGDAPCRACGYGDVLDDLEDAPTIIPAEESE